MKPVILVIVDALTSRFVMPAMERGELPALASLARVGALNPTCISMFPSITPAATATLLTGAYPYRHGIAGASWYDDEQQRVIYYSTDIWTILREGMGNFFEDFLYQLNHVRLQVPTLFEHVERAGFSAASLNNLLYRGDVEHELKVPMLLRLLPGMPSSKQISGPTGLLLGEFAQEGLDAGGPLPKDADGVPFRFGMDDATTAQALLHLARTDTLPVLTVAYFPDTDFKSHKVGPAEALETVRKVDDHLAELIETLGGVERLAERYCLVVTGDHSHAAIVDDNAGITLDELIPELKVASSGSDWQDEDLLICMNLRAAQIYMRAPSAEIAEQIAASLLADGRIDQLFWRPRDVKQRERGYVVVTADRGRLRFWAGADGNNTARDAYDQAWSWEGDLRSLDASVEKGRLNFGVYPNAFERIAAGLDHKSAGPLWVTARPGYSLHLSSMSGIEIHGGGGNHGALHADDSVVPLFLVGAPDGVAIPEHPRTVDVAPLCLAAIGIPNDLGLGISRIDANGSKPDM